MERIDIQEFYKTVEPTETEGEPQQVLDYTMRYTYNIEAVMVGILQEDGTTIHEPQEVETLVKTEKVMNDVNETTYLITEQSGCVCVMQTYPVVEVVRENTQLEILQETVDALVLSSLGV